jgi:hypothetical protein
MAFDIRIEHAFDCTAEDFWSKIYFDPDYTRALFLEGLGMHAVTILSDSGASGASASASMSGPRVRVVDVQMAPLDLPAVVQKLLKGGLGYRETFTFDAAKNTGEFKYTFNQLTDRLDMRGRMRTEAAGEGRSRRLGDIHFEAKVFGIGGIVERVTEKITRDTWEKAAQFTRAWIAKKPR